MKFPFFLVSWHGDRSGTPKKYRQSIPRAFLRAVLAEIWWKHHLRHLKKRTKIFDRFKTLKNPPKGKYLSTPILSVKEKMQKTRDFHSGPYTKWSKKKEKP